MSERMRRRPYSNSNPHFFALLLALISLALSGTALAAADASPHPTWPGPGQLFVGTCYQPIDRSPEQIDQDIAIMKHAGFNVVRMGDLSWDSFEPSQGQFTFDWFDKVMDKMQANGIRVILDIPGLPAPIWLHRTYPGVDIVAQNGTRLPPAERYMDNISDPDYVREVGIMADTMMKRYAHHPAIIAVGYDNEIGNGFMSYSEADRQRFITWLKKKYGTIGELNKAWATQRWSRRLISFEDVDLPLADGPGPSERYLDLHRYWSDVTVAGLMMGAQGILAWTFNSHQGGEEQALFGLVDHDGTPSWKVDEFARIASEFKQLSKYGFPRYTHPEVAIAYSFDSFIDSHPNGPSNTTLQYFKPPYTEQVQGAFEPFFRANLDTAIINIGHENLSSYKLVVVPADYLMDAASAKAIREYVSNGGTVLMTAFSAKVDEHGQWFDTPLPGRLSDVFGLKTNAFYDSTVLKIDLDGKSIAAKSRRYEVLEPTTATVLARFTNIPAHSPAITINRFGKGNALYFATESNPSTIGPVLERVLRIAGIQTGPATPEGVYARSVDGRTLYVNTTEEKKTVPLEGRKRGMLTNRVYEGAIVLDPLASDLVQ